MCTGEACILRSFRMKYSGVLKMASASPQSLVSELSSPWSAIKHPSFCLRLLSTPCFYTVHDHTPGSTSILSFVSDVALFPYPLLLRDWSFDLFCPSAGVSPSNGWVLATPRNICWTVLLPMPRDCIQVPARPRKTLQDSVAAAFQGLWKITAHIWHQTSPLMTLFQHQQMWLFSWVH